MSFWAAFLGSALAYGTVAAVNWGVQIVVRSRRRRIAMAALRELFGPMPEPDLTYRVPAPSNPNVN